MQGRFITFDGGDGGGKSTQARLLAERLAARGEAVVATREPGGSPGAEAIRGFVTGPAAAALSARAEALLHYAARADHLDTLIRPALAAGRWVVCDRFADSTRAYQGAGQGADGPWLERLDAVVVAADQPDLTLILDIGWPAACRRLAGRGGGGDRYEDRDAGFHERVRAAFLAIAAAFPDRCRVIDAGAPAAAVEAAVWAAVAARFALPPGLPG